MKEIVALVAEPLFVDELRARLDYDHEMPRQSLGMPNMRRRKRPPHFWHVLAPKMH
jgi:hypothetical protein